MTGDHIRTGIAAIALALSATACDQAATNTNTANVNANRNNVIVTNANSNTAANTNTTRDRDLTRADFDREKDRYAREAKESGRKIGTGADDLWIWAKARTALVAADDLRDSTISVDVENNAATLTGTVASQAQKTRAEEVVKGIEGVKSVRNQLTVSASGTNTNTAGNSNSGNRRS
jgi:hypothetical protein